MQPYPKAQPCTKTHPIFTNLQLVRGLPQLLEMAPGLAMVITIIPQPPVRVEVHVIEQPAIGPDLQAPDTDRVPESADTRLY